MTDHRKTVEELAHMWASASGDGSVIIEMWIKTLDEAYLEGRRFQAEEDANMLSDRWPTAVGAANALREAAKKIGGEG